MAVLKLSPVLALTLMTASCLFWACDKQVQDYSIPNAQEIVEEYNKGKQKRKQGAYVKGPVQVSTFSDGDQVFVNLDMKEGASGSLRYVLQMKNEQNPFEDSILENAELIYVRRSLVLNSLTSPYRVLVSVDPTENIFKSLHAIENISHRISATGLIRTFAAGDEVSFRAGLHCKCCIWVSGTPQDCGAGGGPGEDGCDSGGYGASSCGIASGGEECQVECGELRYACCWES